MRRPATVLVLSISISCSFAQRLVERSLTFIPLYRHEPVDSRWMVSTGGWGGIGGYRLLRDDEHAWIQMLGGYIELYRNGNEHSLAFQSDIEFIANANNDIRFNPRAIFWEEGFLYTTRSNGSFYQVGYFHRCKHDIDNLLVGRERSLIFGSLLGKYSVPFSDSELEGLFVARADIYTIRQDDRAPSVLSDKGANWKRMVGTLGTSLHVRTPQSAGIIGWYVTSWAACNFFGEKESILASFGAVNALTLNGGISAGFSIQGAAHFRFGFTYEYLSDTGINPDPEHAHLVSFGVVIVNPVTMW